MIAFAFRESFDSALGELTEKSFAAGDDSRAAQFGFRGLPILKRVRARRLAFAEAYAAFETDVGEGSPLDFFTWLIEHADQIFALITKIISLFT